MLQSVSNALCSAHEAHVETAKAALKTERPLKLHFGCGEHRLDGWINVDLRFGDLRLDLRRPLPFACNSASAVYLPHVLEHLDYKAEALALLREARRVLVPSGRIRVSVPDIGSFLSAYAANETAFFDEFANLWGYSPPTTLLSSFLHYAGAGRFPHVPDRHCFGYDRETLQALLEEAGFSGVSRRRPGESDIAEEDLDYSWACRAASGGRPFALIMEAIA
jgi:SAM-dependent methyltransferase